MAARLRSSQMRCFVGFQSDFERRFSLNEPELFFFLEMLSQISNVNTPKRFGENVHDFNQFSSDLGLFRRLIITMYWPC